MQQLSQRNCASYSADMRSTKTSETVKEMNLITYQTTPDVVSYNSVTPWPEHLVNKPLNFLNTKF